MAAVSGDGKATPIQARAAAHAALGDPIRLRLADALEQSDATPSALASLVGLPSNLATFHLNILERAGIVHRLRSEGDRRRRYVQLTDEGSRLVRASQPEPRECETCSDWSNVLFVCTRNAARSQFARVLWEARTGHAAASAGPQPASAIDRAAASVARRHGLDLERSIPQGYDAIGRTTPSLVISVCDRAYEAGVPFTAPVAHWSIPDPHGRSRAAYEAAFAQLAQRIDRFVAQGVAT